MKLNRKLWTAALAVAMTTPSAMAAQDTAGMHYTSAAEGFYASIRVRYVSNGGDKDGAADIQNSSSRFGVRGTNDLGGGLEGFYQYEAGVGIDDGSSLSTRLGHVGLRGDFGSVVAGSFWPDTYNWVYGSTDVANRHSGNSTAGFGQYRTSKSIQYTTPDLSGFRGAVLVKADSGSTDYDGNGKDDNDIDHWSLAGAYDIAGFSIGASYTNDPDATIGYVSDLNRSLVALAADRLASAVAETGGTVSFRTAYPIFVPKDESDDMPSWAIKLGYSQDNWYVNSWYGVIGVDAPSSSVVTWETMDTDDTSDDEVYSRTSVSPGDTEVFSIAGGISVDKVKVYAVYENREYDHLFRKPGDTKIPVAFKRVDDSRSTLGVQYTLGSNSWTWVEYAGRDFDSSKSEDSDFSIGLGHSF